MFKCSKAKKLPFLIIIQLILFSILSVKINYSIFLIGIVGNISIIMAIYLFYNDSLNLTLTLITSFTLTYFIENLKMPHAIRYIQDYFILIMAIKLIVYFIKGKISIKKIYFPIVIFFIVTLTSFFVNGGNFIGFLLTWFDDYVRYFIIFLAVINLEIQENKLMKIIKGLWYLLLLQVPVVFVQEMWSLKYWRPANSGDIRQDYISGTLGGRGTIELGILLTIGISILFILYIKKKVKLIYFLTVFVLFIAVICISEIKFAFFLIAISFLIIFLTNFSFKSSIVVLLSGIFIIIGFQGLVKLYPDFQNFTSKEYISSYLRGTYAESRISRTNSFIIANEFISKYYSTSILGYGAGNSDKISSIYRFSAFNISQYIIELGYVGIICLYGIFIIMSFISISLLKNGKREFDKILGTTGLILQPIIIIGTFYNRPMVNITFSIFSWVANGVIYRYYQFNKKQSDTNF